MKFDTFAGMASAVGIVLIVTMVAWLGLWGPVDVSALHNWQTLIAGVTTGSMALIAAAIAYRGATAKVRYDREIAERDDLRRKLAIYLKIEFAARELVELARQKSASISFPPLKGQPMRVVLAKEFSIEEPREFEEAWSHLDLFPKDAIAEFRNARNCLRQLARLSAELGMKGVAWGAEERPHEVIAEAQGLLNGLWHSAALVKDELDPLIQRLAPDMDDSERMIRIHGDPSCDDED
jgi:hypothetical protein